MSQPPAAVRPRSLLQHLLTGAVRWKGGTHRAKAHVHPPRQTKKPPARSKRATQRGREVKKYKLKTHQGAMKRFYQRGDGTWMHKAAGKRHLMAGSSRRRQTLRKLKHKAVTAKGIIRKLNRLMPYGSTMRPPKSYTQPLMWERPEGWTDLFYAAKSDDPVGAVKRLMKEQAAEREAQQSLGQGGEAAEKRATGTA